MEEVWNIAFIGLIFFLAFGVVGGIGLAYAAKRFAVKVDPKIEAVRACLPGANCGACGYAGCESYAEATVIDPNCSPGKCPPGGQAVADKIAEITGKAAAAAASIIAVLRCSRNEGEVQKKHAYVGFDTCQAATIAFGGPYECDFACVGYGDCEAGCPFHAIHMHNGEPVIDRTACTGCGKCVEICPKAVLQLVPRDALVYVPCSTHDSGKAVTNICKVGCNHCQACTRKAKDVVNMVNDRIEIDYEKCDEEMAKAGVWACNRLIFRYIDPARQAQALEEIRAEQAAKKAAAAAKKAASEGEKEALEA